MKRNFTNITATFIILFSSILVGQSNQGFDASLGGSLVSRHIWRGLQIGATQNSPAVPHIQPIAVVGYSFGAPGKLELGFLGTYGISNEYSESDFFLRYAVDTKAGSFALRVFDYHYPFKGLSFTDFDNDGNGAHTIELSLQYSGPENFPIGVFVSNNVYNVMPDDNTLYFELNYPVLVEDVALNLFAGVAQGQSVWHVVTTDKFEVTNIGFSATKGLQISETFVLPVSAIWTYNPHLKKSYIQFKISI